MLSAIRKTVIDVSKPQVAVLKTDARLTFQITKERTLKETQADSFHFFQGCEPGQHNLLLASPISQKFGSTDHKKRKFHQQFAKEQFEREMH